MSSDECYNEFIDDDDSEECYNEFIEYDSADTDINEKNAPSSSKRKRTRKTTVLQFQKISDFMSSHKKKTLGRRAFEDSWDTIVRELNDLGPPSHASEKWNKIWIDYKSKNLKRAKLNSIEHSESADKSHPETESQIEEQSSSSSSAVVAKQKRSRKSTKESPKIVKTEELMSSHLENPEEHQTTSSLSSHTFRLNVMETLGSINENTKILKENIKAMLAQGHKTIELLEKLVTK